MSNPSLAYLASAGLNQTEASVYVACLRLGLKTAQVIIKETGIPRATTYGTLERLVKKGLVTTIEKKGVTYFCPELPQKLQTLANQRLREAKKATEEISLLIPFLSSLTETAKNPGKIRVFEGESAARNILFDSLDCSDPFIRTYANVEDMITYANNANSEYLKERIRRPVYKRGIVVDTPAARKIMDAYDRSATAIKYIPLPGSGFHGELNIYSGKVSYVTYRANRLLGFIAEEPDYCRLQQAIFDRLWDSNLITRPGVNGK